ncbi:MAG TPA: glycosyltransferase [Nevskiaceae bacterium]|nr:glycosyltransferase [Nevskiaceae bacterium]
MDCRFSVVLPVYNGASYVGTAVRSILDQTFADFELVVLDNCSDDGTAAIVAAAAGGDPRVRLLGSDSVRSMEQNWDRARQLCAGSEIRGEFLTLIGHDDLLLPGFLQTISDLIRACPQARLYQTHFRIIDGSGQVRRRCRPIPLRESAAGYFRARCWGMRDSFGTGQVFRRQDYLACGGIPQYPRLLYADDMLWLKLLGEHGEMACSEQVCFEYRLHDNNTSSIATTAAYQASLAALRMFVEEIDAQLPWLLDGEMNRAGLKLRLTSALREIEKGSYRLGFDPALVNDDWTALAARHDRLGQWLNDPSDVPLTLRPRRLKRALHALRRWRRGR